MTTNVGDDCPLARLMPGQQVVVDYRRVPTGSHLTLTLRKGICPALVEDSEPREGEDDDDDERK